MFLCLRGSLAIWPKLQFWWHFTGASLPSHVAWPFQPPFFPCLSGFALLPLQQASTSGCPKCSRESLCPGRAMSVIGDRVTVSFTPEPYLGACSAHRHGPRTPAGTGRYTCRPPGWARRRSGTVRSGRRWTPASTHPEPASGAAAWFPCWWGRSCGEFRGWVAAVQDREKKSGVWGFHLVIGPGVARMQSGSREVAGWAQGWEKACLSSLTAPCTPWKYITTDRPQCETKPLPILGVFAGLAWSGSSVWTQMINSNTPESPFFD